MKEESKKSVLVIDTPNCCVACPCHSFYPDPNDFHYCNEAKRIIGFGEGIPEWCPLKPLPVKSIEDGLDSLEVKAMAYFETSGWNQCIDYISGEKK